MRSLPFWTSTYLLPVPSVRPRLHPATLKLSFRLEALSGVQHQQIDLPECLGDFLSEVRPGRFVRNVYRVGLRLQRGVQSGQNTLCLLQVRTVDVDESKVHALFTAELGGCEANARGRARDEGGCFGA